ncbi:MAG TPA: MlaD family protein [Methylomirabilota bacterium]|nr:MlaD family protein [Methylomirabilota bacterium]
MKPRYELKVGLFVLVSLVLLAGLIMRFSKGASPLTKVYHLNIQAENVGGIIPGAGVLMAGVPIGSIREIELNPDGKTVTMRARILAKYPIRSDAILSIRQAGFLGDRFIGVTPTENKGEILKNNDEVICEQPFDIAEVARSASSLMNSVNATVNKLNQAVARLDTTVLAEPTLTNLTSTVANFQGTSARALLAVEHLDQFITTNTAPLNASMSNLNLFTKEVNLLTGELRETLATNRAQLTVTMRNIESATRRIDQVLQNVQGGQGLAGKLLTNEEMASNISILSSNLAVLSSNVNNKGLWGVIRKPKSAKD